MGVPSFYKWLVDRYPRAVVAAEEDTPVVANGVTLPIDSSLPNPNGFEFDNLYLDMNCIIHPCFHPEDLPPPSTYDEIFVAVFKYIDRLFSIVRPRKLLYLAIDGVAPRAKMNQQRSRRFRAAKEAADAALMAEELGAVVEEEQKKSNMDSNIITPGTEFMDLLSSALRYYIQLRMNTDSGWKGIKVILSDASVPGEGEHKIMSYIRLQRNLPGFDPNTRHCLYGLDADLIFLALATHEIHFTILREDVRKVGAKFQKSKNAKELKEGLAEQGFAKHIEDYITGIDFQFLKIWVLREYLAYDMRIPDSTVEMDLERLIDDFVFMCLFVGNDFLPHIPSLEIPEGALDLLMMVYKREFLQMGGYLTNSYEINLDRVEHFVRSIGYYESAIFRKRNGIQKGNEARFKRPKKKSRKISNGADGITGCKIEKSLQVQEVREHENVAVDKVMLGEEGWKERFYMEKFDVKTEEERERIQKDAVLKYVEGISWVMRYYYDGVCSWQWFYPYHYAPFASDFHRLGRLQIHFTLGRPFKPFDQLMGVLPAASAHALPLSYRKLMTDDSSPLLDFYPTDFEVDLNGKRFSWQGVCKLPFIDESRLLLEMAKVEHTLTDDEKRRNSLGLDILFIHISHPLACVIISLFQPSNDSKLPEEKMRRIIDPKISGGLNGYIHVSDEPIRAVEVHSPVEGMQTVLNSCVISVFYCFPEFHPHIPRLPEGVIVPAKSVRKNNILPPNVLWHNTTIRGRVFDRRPIQNCVSGLGLGKLCHWLVSDYHSKQQGGAASIKPGLPTDAGKLGNVGTAVKADEKENKPKTKRKRGSENKNKHDRNDGSLQNGIVKANEQKASLEARSKTNRRRRKCRGKNQSGGRSDGVAQNITKLNGNSNDKKLVSSSPNEGVDAPNNIGREKSIDCGEVRANAKDASLGVQPNSRKRKRKTKNGKANGGATLKNDVKMNGSSNNSSKQRRKRRKTAVKVST